MDNTKKLSHLGLCSGYGGIERGIELTGTKLRSLAHVEIEAYAIANMVAKMEEGAMAPSPIWTDLKTLPLEPFRGAVDLLTGGYPCQPFSLAGKRLGAEDPRHLWPHILKIIDGIMPRMCFFENVEGHVNNGLQQVLSDLEARGYSCSWGIFSAEEVGAPHRRKRIFILADSLSSGMCRGGSSKERRDDSERIQSDERERNELRGKTERLSPYPCPDVAHANSCGSGEDQQQAQPRTTRTEQSSRSPRGRAGSTEAKQVQRWPSRPTENQHEWETTRTVERSLGGATHGSSSRVDELRLLGNGVVPQTAALAWQTLSAELEVEP